MYIQIHISLHFRDRNLSNFAVGAFDLWIFSALWLKYEQMQYMLFLLISVVYVHINTIFVFNITEEGLVRF